MVIAESIIVKIYLVRICMLMKNTLIVFFLLKQSGELQWAT